MNMVCPEYSFKQNITVVKKSKEKGFKYQTALRLKLPI
jgi:hypothetical protein